MTHCIHATRKLEGTNKSSSHTVFRVQALSLWQCYNFKLCAYFLFSIFS